jgi:polyprenyl-phospho-N-acetylgalactosaminyl synthase
MKIIAIIPALNEDQVIYDVITRLRPHVDEVIVVDDGSTDFTVQESKRAGAQVISHIINRGQGAALQTGTELALQNGAEIIIHFDADGQSPEEQIAHLVAPIKAGEVEVVLGSRFLKDASHIPVGRRITLWWAKIFTRGISGLDLTDSHCGFRALHSEAAKKIQIQQDSFAHASEILQLIARHKLSYTELPVNIRYTEYSQSRGQAAGNDARNALRIVIDLIKGALF